MTAIVADTHTIVWYVAEPEQLSQNASLTLDRATSTGQSIYVSAISIVEICYLVERRRLPELVLQRLLHVSDAADGVVQADGWYLDRIRGSHSVWETKC